jgi:hypothetical protein
LTREATLIMETVPATVVENFVKAYRRFVQADLANGTARVLDLTQPSVTRACGDIFASSRFEYVATDGDRSGPFDIVLVSGSSLPELNGLLKDAAWVFWLRPRSSPDRPGDSFDGDAAAAGLRVEQNWFDARGPKPLSVGVLRRGPPASQPRSASPPLRPLAEILPANPIYENILPGTPEEERTAGSGPYLRLLERIHAERRPSLYVEIGVRTGGSLQLARGDAIGIDPYMADVKPGPSRRLFHETSDDFFDSEHAAAIDRGIEFALIDGLHLFEFALRDFMNLEMRCSRSALIAIDDVFPNASIQGSRLRCSRVWTGDVWRLPLCLEEFRPDLKLLRVDTAPTGLVLVSGLDPTNRDLWNKYDLVLERYLRNFPLDPPASVLSRAGSVPIESAELTAFLRKPAPF